MKLLSVWGVQLRVNGLFVLLLLGLAWADRLVESLIVFTIVTLHEFGHVVAAKGCGIDVQEVELLPFGGVARMEGLLETDPTVETTVALAGPLTNVVLMVFGAFVWRWHIFPEPSVLFFIGANAAVCCINLVPALPLDGGRLYRAYRSRHVGFRRATTEAVRIGRVLAVVLVSAGAVLLYVGVTSVTLLVLGVFVYIAAGKEQETAAYTFMAHLARKQEELGKYGCMGVETLAATQDATLKQVLERFMPQKYHVVWIVDEEGRLIGVASERDVLDALFERGPDLPIRSIAQWQFIDRK